MDNIIDIECNEMFRKTNLNYYTNNDLAIIIPDHTFHAIFLFYHILRHAQRSDIGIRQFCDWVLFCKEHLQEINTNHLQTLIRQAGIASLWNRYAKFCHEYLNCNAIPHNKCRSNVDWLWQLCKYSGNMGKQRPQYKRKSYKGKNTIKSKWATFKELFERYNVESSYSSRMAFENLVCILLRNLENHFDRITRKTII